MLLAPTLRVIACEAEPDATGLPLTVTVAAAWAVTGVSVTEETA